MKREPSTTQHQDLEQDTDRLTQEGFEIPAEEEVPADELETF